MKHIFLIFFIFTFVSSFSQSIITLDMPMPCTGPASVKENPEKNLSFDFAITPNPAKGEFSLLITSGENLGTMTIEVCNTSGSPVLNEDFTSNTTSHHRRFNVTHLPQGTYIITLYRNKEKRSKKLILNKE